MYNWKVGQRVKIVGRADNYTMEADGTICTIKRLHPESETCVVEEECPAKYKWWVYFDQCIPVNKVDEEIDYDWLELGDLDDAI